MRILMTALGAAAILAYAVIGALMMTRWEIAAGAGMPLDEAVAEIQAAGQPYGVAAGVIFAVLGAALAAGWVWLVSSRGSGLPGWAGSALWGGIVACGAPAYFFLSFGNMMSVGDTFSDWYPDAAFAVVRPLYFTSATAAVLVVVACVVGFARARQVQPWAVPA